MDKLPLQPIILCGGSGSRLWPLSRESFPKQYLNLISNTNNSLLQQTYLRLKGIQNIYNPILICNEQHRFIVAEQMREVGIEPKDIILEPSGRNTAPAVAVAALTSLLEKKDSILLVLAADHSFQNIKKFLEVIDEGYKEAKLGNLVTFGIKPDSPNTGFGYIESEQAFDSKVKPSSIVKFIEKPNLTLAKKLILDKKYSWNSGIFMFKASKIISEFNNLAPDILNICRKSLDSSKKDLDFLRLNEDYFLNCPNISLDKAIMEKTKFGIVLPLDAGWSDVGNWQSIWEKEKKDKNGNVIIGKVLFDKVKNSYIRSEKRLIACLGVEDLIIVENCDSILITKKSLSHEVKSIVKKLEKNKFIEGKVHQKAYRPWGNYISIADDSRWQVKKIEVKPSASLSLQMHHHRSEHWVVVKGTAKVELNGEEIILTENQSIYIPLGSKHRLTNPGKIPLTLIEVQSGPYVGEDDIVRFKDSYGRG